MMEPNLIIPKEGKFKWELENGASQLSTYDEKFEIFMDIQEHKRENLRIKISRNGIINIRILSDPPKKGEPADVLYDENCFIPEHEKAIRNSFICQTNGNGILRISGIFSTMPDQGNLINFEKNPIILSSQGMDEDELENEKKSAALSKLAKRKPKKFEIQEEEEKPQDIHFRVKPKPLDSDFECDISLIQDRPEFRATADMTWRTFVNCSNYPPEDIKIEIVNNNIVRISKIKQDPFSRPFLKEIRIPSHLGCKPQDIEVTFNTRGVLRLVAETEESRLLEKKVIIQKASTPAPVLTPIKPILVGSTVRTKEQVSTPWGQRVATATVKAQVATPTETSSEKFEASINAQDYAPDEIQIKISDGWLTITGKKKASPFGENTFRNKTFTKKIQIPEAISAESIVCGQDPNTGIIQISTAAGAATS